MSAFTVHATLKNPEDRERSAAADFLVDTGAIYTTLPAELVAHLELATPYERTVEFANGERDVWRMGEVRITLGGEEHPTMFLAGPLGCRPLLGAVTLEQFGLAVDPAHERLVPVPSVFI